jgi:hypothetical protein
MFASFDAEIAALVAPAHATATIAGVALRDRFDAQVAGALGTFGAAGGHELDGSLTLASWLGHRAGMDPASAKREALRHQRLVRLPVLRRAVPRHRVSPIGTYTGDPPPGMTVGGPSFGGLDPEVCHGLVPVVPLSR